MDEEERAMLRVLQVVTKMDRGGLETMLMNYYRNIDICEMCCYTVTQITVDAIVYCYFFGVSLFNRFICR